MDKNKFEYSYYAPTEEERKEIDSIRKEYQPKNEKEGKLEQLRTLDKKVKRPATALSLGMGIVGILLFGLGMAMVLEWQLFIGGIIVAVVGCVPIALAHTVYGAILKRNKKKYGEQIVSLSEELLNLDKG